MTEEETNQAIQDAVTENEILQTAKVAAQAIIDAEAEAAEKWYIKLRNWFCRTVKNIVKIVCETVQGSVLYIINNEKNQTLAKLAVLTAIEAGLKGDNAFAAAYKILNEGELFVADGVSVKGTDISTNIKETLIQLVYCMVKNKIKTA